jgi:hypothetical protein
MIAMNIVLSLWSEVDRIEGERTKKAGVDASGKSGKYRREFEAEVGSDIIPTNGITSPDQDFAGQ